MITAAFSMEFSGCTERVHRGETFQSAMASTAQSPVGFTNGRTEGLWQRMWESLMQKLMLSEILIGRYTL